MILQVPISEMCYSINFTLFQQSTWVATMQVYTRKELKLQWKNSESGIHLECKCSSRIRTCITHLLQDISGAETIAKRKVTPILLYPVPVTLGECVFVQLPNWMKISNSSSPDAMCLAWGTLQPCAEEVTSLRLSTFWRWWTQVPKFLG